MLSFDAWKGAKVNPTTHAVVVLPIKDGPKAEPTSPLLVATLVHPERKASVGQVKYSEDGKRLFVAGYPSGVVQFFDLETKKELRRIDTPKGWRGSMEYAFLTPDWKTLYVTDERKRKVVPVEIDGKKDHRIEYSGHVLAWDMTTGQSKDGLAPETNCGANFAKMSPDGTKLLVVEFETVLASKRAEEKRRTFAWDLTTGTKSKVGDGFLVPTFLPDGKTGLLVNTDYEAKTSVLQRIDLATGKVLASRDTPEKGLSFSVSGVSSDGKLVAVSLGGKKGATPTTLFVDPETLKDVATLTGEATPDGYGWNGGSFSPDGKVFQTTDGNGSLRLWDVAARKVVRTIRHGDGSWWRRDFSPDGEWLAVAWMPKWDEEQEGNREPDPADLPQPRVTLYNLADEKAKPVVLMCPHGYVGSLAFRPDGKQLAFGSAGGVHLFDMSKLGK